MEETTFLSMLFSNFLISRPESGQTQLVVTDSFLLGITLLTIGYVWLKGVFKKKRTG